MEIRAVNHRAAGMASRIHAVQIAAYAQEAELLGAVSFPPQAGFVEHARRTVGAEALPLVVLRKRQGSVSCR